MSTTLYQSFALFQNRAKAAFKLRLCLSVSLPFFYLKEQDVRMGGLWLCFECGADLCKHSKASNLCFQLLDHKNETVAEA